LNPRFKGLFQNYDGKPLMLILDTGALGHKKGTAKSAFTVPFFEMTLAMKEGDLDAFRRAQVLSMTHILLFDGYHHRTR